ncbi:alpha/beta hydrolase [Aurantimonas marianensis]|uniref:Dienelactone hydrolase family protein n=1 Tax=Aurantimonas marianensis TaxID=2920428 RepID=A0A9X2H424_9HYPH|nr:dienelactone hydrolase family protein [Aurantimonas marianensis]MCP3054877.1 dienelactone hydrolase family protein [Aurantimonas marianensis]
MTERDEPAFLAEHRLKHTGAPLAEARRVMLCLHGRGASAEDILSLGEAVALPGLAAIAPQAEGGAWYPRPFMEPLAANEPFLSAALDRIDAILDALAKAGLGSERVVLAGFSQGACLALEFAARNPGRVAGVLGFSGGLIGPSVAERTDSGDLAGLPVFMGCSERDPFIPATRVRETAEHLRSRGAKVTAKLYPEPGHAINMDEIEEARGLIAALAA